jgi:hypothetical protein
MKKDFKNRMLHSSATAFLWLQLLCLLVAPILESSAAADSDEKAACLEGQEIRRGAEWINAKPELIALMSERFRVQDSQIYEVVASQLLDALDELKTNGIKPLSESEAKVFAGQSYSSSLNEKSCLVRAVYCSANPCRVYVIRDDLVVTNLTVGSLPVFRKSALVIRLKALPRHAYVYAAAEAE